MLRTRALTTLLLGPLFIGVLLLGSPYIEILLLAIIGATAREFDKICNGYTTGFGMAVAVTAIILGLLLVVPGGRPELVPWFAGSCMIFFIIGKNVLLPEQPKAMAYALLYTALPGLGLLYIFETTGAETVIWLVVIVWATDIGAYLFGKTFKGPKLAPQVSPNKTWAGLLGGVACASAVALATAELSALNSAQVLVPLAACLALAAQAGDLLESAIKRMHGKKDSGRMLPGHGGVMDRFDGLWGMAPAAAAVCMMAQGGIRAW